MKRIGIIGGMSFESTIHYYDRINREVNQRAGGDTSADLVLRSVNFEEYRELMKLNQWPEIAHRLSFEALDLTLKDNCEYVAIATNTMHKVADYIVGPHEVIDSEVIWPPIKSYQSVPLVHIGDCVADECKERGFKRVAIIGTKFTMTEDFMKNRLRQNGLEIVDTFISSEIDAIDHIIFDELCHGIIKPESREAVTQILARADSRDYENEGTGFDAVILGCTELENLTGDWMEYYISNPRHNHHYEFVNSTQAHINRIVDLCLEDEKENE